MSPLAPLPDELRDAPPPGLGRAQSEDRPGSAVARAVAAVVGFCVANAWLVVVVGLVLAGVCSIYAAGNFQLNSDINALLPSNVDWRRHEVAFEKVFGRFDVLEAVVEAPTPELTAVATSELASALDADKARFKSAANVGDSRFFRRHGLLYLSTEELKRTAAGLVEGEPIIQDIATDRSLRGLVAGLEDALIGLQSNRLKLDDFARPLNMVSDSLEKVLAGKPSSFSWQVLTAGEAAASPSERLGFVEINPVLDFNSVQPGQESETAIHRLAAPIEAKYQARVRVTGPIAIDDEEFGSIKENAVRNGVATIAIVLFILWMALRSGRLILALVVNLVVGLAATAALGLFMIGAFNIISIYFAVLFVGIGVDFAIQFSVRYRDERHRLGDLETALRSAGSRVAMPLALASLATAAGFFSFLPTDYKGVSELGQIAGAGMLIAFVTSMTLLPALIRLANPSGEPEALGYTFLAPVDEYMARHRIPIIVGTLLVVACVSPLLGWLQFDFNPLNLQNPNSEAIATYLELRKDRAVGANNVQAIAPSLEQANAVADRLMKLPEVEGVRTLSTFIPSDQDIKIPIIRSAATKLAGAFDAREGPPPTEAENVDALNEAAQRLTEAAGEQRGPGAAAMRRLAALLSKLAQASPEARAQASETLIQPLNADLADLQALLEAKPVTQADLPPALVEDWIGPKGEARLSIMPKANPDDTAAIRRFVAAVLAVEPDAAEGPIATIKAGDMILRSFVEAGAWALASIALLLLLFLRRITDVLLTLVPLALAGLVTMELMTLIGMPFNFANIIALPLLLGVGVAFKIYYIVAWREGTTHLLQTPLTRAVFYSALTTATAFGSLWFSSNPGASSMGKLLALSLICTLAAAVLFQPILMGKPRSVPDRSP